MKKIMLRPLAINDLDSFMVWATDSEVTRHLRWEPYTSRVTAKDFFKNVVEKHPWFQAIVRKGNIEDLYLYAFTR